MRGGNMYQVSEEYKKSMKRPFINRSFMNVMLGLINQDAQRSAEIQDMNKYTGYSSSKSVFENNTQKKQYATFEQDFFKADGSMIFLPREDNSYIKNSIVTEALVNGSFMVKIVFGTENTDIKGLSITFGENYPTSFSVMYNGTSVDFENNSENFTTEKVFNNTNSLTLFIKSMKKPNGRLRILSIMLGLGLSYDNETIIQSNSSSSLSIINDDLPEVDFSVELSNQNQFFNVDNPNSAIYFLEPGQKIDVTYGYELDDGSIEWQPLHSLYVSEWSSDDETATIRAVDRLKFMDEYYYKGQYYENGISLYDLAVLVFEDAGLTEEDYYIESFLRNVKVNNPLPNVMHKEALQIIANTGRCYLDYDRKGKIRINSAFVPNFTTTSNGTAFFSDVKSIDNQNEKDIFATYGENSWKADGESFFIKKNGIVNSGYVSSQISNEKCLFTVNPKITRQFENKYKIFDLLIKFSGNLPKRFVIRTYSENSLVETITIEKGIKENYGLNYNFKEFDKMEIEFTETQVPNNHIQVDYISIGNETDYKLSYDYLFNTPKGYQLDKIKTLKVARTILSKSTTEEELTNDKFVFNGEHQIYFFQDPCFDYSAIIKDTPIGKSARVVNSGAYYVEIEVTGFNTNEEVEITILGKKYNISTVYNSKQINNRGLEKEWKNPLISDYKQCNLLLDWLSDYFSSTVQYELSYRGEPALDTGDTIFQENKYDDGLKTFVEEIKLSFNGTIKGELLTRRKSNVVRAKN